MECVMNPQRPCPRCTQPLPQAALFCRRCGVAVRPGSAAGRFVPPPLPRRPSGLRWALPTAVLAVLLSVAVGQMFWRMDGYVPATAVGQSGGFEIVQTGQTLPASPAEAIHDVIREYDRSHYDSRKHR